MRHLVSAFLTVFVLTAGSVSADESPDADPQLRRILDDLAAADFATRQAAQSELEQLTAEQIAALPDHIASLSSAEAAVRCAQALNHHFLSDDKNAVWTAWTALEALQSSDRAVVRDEAAWILDSHWNTRLRLVSERLSQHGALVLLPETIAAAQAVHQARRARTPGVPAGRAPGRLFVQRTTLQSTQVFLTDEWTGDLEALQLLQRMPGLQMDNQNAFGANAGGARGAVDGPTPVAIFLVAGHSLSDEARQWLQASFASRIQDRGLVMLGITSNAAVAGTGCPVNAVVPFGSGDAAGIQSGDLITSVGGNQVLSFDDVVDQLRQHAAGESVDVKLTRVEYLPGNPIPTENTVTRKVKLRSWADYAKAILAAAAEKDAAQAPQEL